MKFIGIPFNLISFISVFLILVISCCQAQQTDYRKNLNIISEIENYQVLLKEDPKNELVDLEVYIPGIVLDIRYASENNFTNQVIYESAKAFVRKPVAEALGKIQTELKSQGLGLKIFDAYRPYSATVKFYEVYPDTNFVAAPWKGSVHNRGCAIDLTLVDLKTNQELEMPTPFDDFTEKAAHSYSDLPDIVLENRKLLREIMDKHGFSVYNYEWWHYNFNGWEKFQLMDISFQNLNY